MAGLNIDNDELHKNVYDAVHGGLKLEIKTLDELDKAAGEVRKATRELRRAVMKYDAILKKEQSITARIKLE